MEFVLHMLVSVWVDLLIWMDIGVEPDFDSSSPTIRKWMKDRALSQSQTFDARALTRNSCWLAGMTSMSRNRDSGGITSL